MTNVRLQEHLKKWIKYDTTEGAQYFNNWLNKMETYELLEKEFKIHILKYGKLQENTHDSIPEK